MDEYDIINDRLKSNLPVELRCINRSIVDLNWENRRLYKHNHIKKHYRQRAYRFFVRNEVKITCLKLLFVKKAKKILFHTDLT